MLREADKARAWALAAFYVVFLELTSLGNSLESSPCILVSKYASSENQTNYQSCAPMHEGVLRFISLVWRYTTHDNIIAFGTLAIAVFTWTLWRSSERLWLASDENAKAANRSAKIAEDSLTKLQRAFVNFNGFRYLSHVADDGHVWWSMHFNWINVGISPARKVRFHVSRYFEDVDMPADYPFDTAADRPENFMGPRAEMSTAFGALTADDLTDVRQEKSFCTIGDALITGTFLTERPIM